MNIYPHEVRFYDLTITFFLKITILSLILIITLSFVRFLIIKRKFIKWSWFCLYGGAVVVQHCTSLQRIQAPRSLPCMNKDLFSHLTRAYSVILCISRVRYLDNVYMSPPRCPSPIGAWGNKCACSCFRAASGSERRLKSAFVSNRVEMSYRFKGSVST